MKKPILSLAVLILLQSIAWCQIGLDPTFGKSGYATASIFPSDDSGTDLVLQSDGKAVVVGRAGVDSVAQFVALRFWADGSPDLSFQWNSKTLLEMGNGPAVAQAVVLDAAGNIVMAGYATQTGDERFALARLLPDGNPDLSFGTAGRLFTDFGAAKEQANAVVIQPDGRIIAAGFTGAGRKAEYALARYLPNGTLDPAFGVGGKVVTPIDTLSDIIWDLALQSDGKIVVCGSSADPMSFNFPADFVMVRYNTDGSLDQNFGTKGIQRIDVLGDNDVPRAIKIYPSGRMLVAGFATESPRIKVVLIRLRSNGALDNFFGTGGGISSLDVTTYGNFCQDLDFATDGKILLTGMAENVDFRDVFVMRLSENGIVDNTFGQNGKVLRSLTPKDDNAYAISVRPDGKILIAGDTRAGDAFTGNMALFQFNPDGTDDTNFGQNGSLHTDVSTSLELAHSILVQPDNSLMLAGSATNEEGREDALLLKMKQDGNLDKNYATEGVKVYQFSTGRDVLHKIVRQGDGKIMAAGITGDRATVFRFGTDGIPDPSFGTNGRVLPNLPPPSHYRDIYLQNDGKCVVAGYEGGFVGQSGIIMRFLPNGKIDSTFGSAGKLALAVGSEVVKLQPLSNNELLALVNRPGPNTAAAAFYVYRLKNNGEIDVSFATNGVYASEAAQTGRSLALGKNGSILVAGASLDKNLVVKLLENGSADVSFGPKGARIFGKSPIEALTDIGIQPDQRIVVTGHTTQPGLALQEGFLVYRLNPDGSPDGSWGQDGRIALRGETANALTQDAAGNWYAAGSINNGERSDVLAVRLLRGTYLGVLDGAANNHATQIQVFPNPIADILNVKYDLIENQEVTIQLYDLNGRLVHVFCSAEKRESGQHTERLAFPSGLSAGTYMLQLSTTKGRVGLQVFKTE